MTSFSVDLLRVVDSAEPILREIAEEDSKKPVLAGGWSRKQVINHLIDSASNNHQRFVRAAIQTSLEFPAYDQEQWVRVEAPDDAPWTVLVELWANYNRFLAHVIAKLPSQSLTNSCRIGDDDPVTLGFLVQDYMRHLLHHLRQIEAMRAEVALH